LKTLKVDKFIDQPMTFTRSAIDEAFLKVLNFVLEEIFNPDVPFEEDKSDVQY
jgi:hypothetical protein